MKAVFCLVGMVFLVILHGSYAPPVSPEKKEEDSEIKEDLEDFIEYQRYLQEVVQALESDPEFRERLEKADEEDVRSGKIAEQLDFVNHNVRTKLDEIKRREMERLRHLAKKQFEFNNELDDNSANTGPTDHHLDHSNPHTFEIEDLKKLIKQTTADLEAADKRRKEEFKEYEMKKEFEKHQKLEAMDEAHKAEYEAQLKKEEEALKHHKPIHHPGSKQQLEEVWEKQDHMDQQFDPKAFFMMHDVDGNGVWDADEVKALFIKELDKLYGPGGPNKDLHERAEEMERMREHVFQENDRNRDGLIDFREFMMETQRADFNQDEGWKSIDENQIYTQNEYQEYERKKMEELRYLQSLGLVDSHGRPVPGAEHQIHKALQQFAAQYHPMEHPPQHPSGQPMGYPQQQPPQYQQQPPQYQQQPPQYQQQPPQYQQQPPQYQQIPQGQVPQGQYQQVPQGQPQGQYQGQMPQGHPAQGQYQGQITQGQVVQGQGQQGQMQGQGQAQAQPIQGQPTQGQPGQAQQQGQPGQAQQQGQGQQGQAQGQPTQGQAHQGQAPQGQQPPQNNDLNHGQAPGQNHLPPTYNISPGAAH
ncbi:nucleobindin-2 isoform X2 [Epargyreus clarus]|uniref:nucleobindin-2 isoform X2 n=1 Tax=Epargyreus clarus TaxID=520877 RepID=UPI003C2E672A